MKLSHLSIVFLSLLIAMFFTGCAKHDDKTTLTVGILYGEYSYHIGKDGARGFEYELVTGFANYAEKDLELIPFSSVTKMRAEQNKQKLDLVITGSGINKANSKSSWGPNYNHLNYELVYLQGRAKPNSLSDINTAIGVVAGLDHSNAALAKEPDIQLLTTDSKSVYELLMNVANGSLAYTLADSYTLNLMQQDYPQLALAFTLSHDVPVAWQITAQTDDSLQSLLFEYFNTIKNSGELQKVRDKYFYVQNNNEFVDSKYLIDFLQTMDQTHIGWFKQAHNQLDWRLLLAMNLHILTKQQTSTLTRQQQITNNIKRFSDLAMRIPARIPSPDRLWMALVAYRIGLTHLEDVRTLTQQQGGNPDIWLDLKKHLPLLQQQQFYSQTQYGYANGIDAMDYVENIRRYHDILIYLEQN